MVIQRSRKWVKDRLPAFICRETSWWVTRWIQCNVFLCPECRKEYRSLKEVWERLDRWEVEDPEGGVEACFIENFRQKYPSAYQEEEATSQASGFWIPRVAYLCALAVLGFAVLWQPSASRTAVRTVKVETPAAVETLQSQIAETAPNTQSSQPLQVADAPSPQTQPDIQASDPPASEVSTGVPRTPSDQNEIMPGTRFRITSTLQLAPTSGEFGELPRREQTIEINDMPATSAFDSLSQPYQEDRPY